MMQLSPPLTRAHKYPVTVSLCLTAIAATLFWWSGGDIKPFVQNYEWPHQPWRLLTYTLLHLNLFHLIFNLYWIWTFGAVLERRFGAVKTALIYVSLAVVPGAAEFAFLRGGVGLSGIVYGQFGLFYVLSRRDPEYESVVSPQIVRLFIGWYFLCIAMTYFGIMTVANIAHGVGALTGCTLGFTIAAVPRIKICASAALVALMLFCFWAASIGRDAVNMVGDTSIEFWDKGNTAMKSGEYTSATQYFQRAIKVNNTESKLWFNLGLSYQHLNQLKEATDAYQRAWDLGLTDDPIRKALSSLYVARGYQAHIAHDLSAAEKLYSQALLIDDTEFRTYYNLALVYLEQGKKAETLQAIQNAASLRPDPQTRTALDALKNDAEKAK